MASGLRARTRKNYRTVLGLKPVPSKTKKLPAKVKKVVAAIPTEQLDFEDVVNEVDMEGERNLFGGGQTSSQEEDSIEEVDVEDLDTEEILALAAEKEARCEELESEMVQLQQQEEEELHQQEQAKQEALEKLMAMHSKRQDLESSLASTPQVSPVLKKSSPTSKFQPKNKPRRSVMDCLGASPKKVVSAGRMKPSTSKVLQPLQVQPGESELNLFAHQLLDSMKALKEGDSAAFTSLMAKTLANNAGADKGVRKAESLPNVHLIDQKVLGTAIELPHDKIPDRGCHTCVKSENSTDVLDPVLGKTSETNEESSFPENTVSHKLKSGITTKPDDSGIKKVVHFAHEKLDLVHVKNRVFCELPFRFLVAGELELLVQEDLKKDERMARLLFLKMLCYHREYLDIEDLRDQYDATLKTIERGLVTWSEFKELEKQMHSSLTFRATVKARQGGNQRKLINLKVGKTRIRIQVRTSLSRWCTVVISTRNLVHLKTTIKAFSIKNR